MECLGLLIVIGLYVSIECNVYVHTNIMYVYMCNIVDVAIVSIVSIVLFIVFMFLLRQ